MSLLPLAAAWMAVSELAPQPVTFYAGVFFSVNATYIGLIRELIDTVDDISPAVRKIMRIRAYTRLCLFVAAAGIALKLPLVGLGIFICCLIVDLRLESIGSGEVAPDF